MMLKQKKRVSETMAHFRRKTGLFNAAAMAKAIEGSTKSDSMTEITTTFEDAYQIQTPCVGKGSFGSVWKAYKEDHQVPFAVKEVKKSGLSQEDINDLKKEISVLRKLRHPNIIEYFDDYDETFKFYIVMEFVTGGTLADAIKKREYEMLSEANIQKYMFQLADALLHCKEMGVVHRDIKPGNVIVSYDVRGEPLAKLIDFGFATVVDLECNDIDDKILDKWCGTIYYASPEIILKEPYNYKTDFWSLGVMLFELLSQGSRPFFFDRSDPRGKRNMLYKIANAYYSFKPRALWREISKEARHMVTRLLTLNPDERFGPEEMLQHPWFSQQFEMDVSDGSDMSVVAESNLVRRRPKQSLQEQNVLEKFRSAVVMQEAVNGFKELMLEEEEEKKEEPPKRSKSKPWHFLYMSSRKVRQELPPIREKLTSGCEALDDLQL